MLKLHATAKEETRTKPIELYVGPYRSGKTLTLLNCVIEHCLSKPEDGAIVVVPSDRYRRLLEERLTALATNSEKPVKGFPGLKIFTFYQCCEYLLRCLGCFEKLVPDAVRPTLMTLVMAKLSEDERLKSIEAILGFPGTPTAVLTLIDELQRSGLNPEQVIVRLHKSGIKTARYLELADVYKCYWEACDSIGYLDRRRLAHRLIALLNVQQRSTVTKRFGLIAFDGFDRFNPLQMQLIAALSSSAEKLLITFDYVEDEAPDYRWKDSSYAQLQAVIGSKSSYIKFPASVPNQPEIERFLAPDRHFEMVEIAARIKSDMARKQREPSQYLVVARSLAKYKSAAEAAFNDAGLDYFIDEPIELKALPIVQFLLKCLSLSAQGFIREDVIFCLRSKYFKQGGFALSNSAVGTIDRISRTQMVVGGIDQWKTAFSGSQDFSYGQVLKSVFDTLSPPKAYGTAEDYVAWAEDLLEKILVPSSQLDFFEPFEQWEQDSALSQFRKTLAALIKEQDLLHRLGGQKQFPFDYFFLRLEKLIDGANFRRQPRSKNYILVCAAELAPNRPFDEIYIAGLSEGEFPKKANQNGFTNGDEASQWFAIGVDIHNPRLHPAFETALFNSLIERARVRAVLSCPVADMSGQELTPSFLLNEVQSKQTEIDFVQPYEKLWLAPNSPRNAIASWLWSHSGIADVPAFLREDTRTAALASNLAEPLFVAGHRIVATNPSAFNGYLADYVATGAISVSLPQHWSASSLSDYGKCPFRFWLSNVLRLEPSIEPAEGLSRKLLGQTYHKALELFYREIIDRDLSIRNSDEQVLLQLLEQATSDAIAWLEANPEFRRDQFWEHRRQEIRFRLNRFFAEERSRALDDPEDFVPLLAEAKFGFDHSDSSPALKIKTSELEILIRGQVDRIDITSTSSGSGQPRLRIIDYKSGSTSITKGDARSGRNLQLPLYALAVQKAIVPNSTVAKAEYLSVAAAKLVGKLDFEKEKAGIRSEPVDLLEETISNISTFVSGIQRGDFSVRPNGIKVCQACDHKMICRISELPQVISEAGEVDNESH